MNISKIEIKNFRSIDKVEVDINEISDKKCLIFLGMNESGKSNILKAISLLDQTQLDNISYSSDCNKMAETNGESIEITYHLEITNFDTYTKAFIEEGYPEKLVDKINITDIHRIITIDENNEKQNSFHIWIEDSNVFSKYVVMDDEIEEIVDDNLNQLIEDGFEQLNKEILESLLESDCFDVFELNVPKTIFWESDEKYLINNTIYLNQFKTDNNISIPLRNIFYIAGIDNIDKRIDLITESREKRKQLEDTLSTSITNYINNVWKEHRVNIKVDIENMQCNIMVEDKDDTEPKYNMNQRSDGFKQFISILLNLSAENSSEKLKNNLILLDEPEIHLHPSGVRYLRDELLNIAKNNIVLIATHSIYMVDKKDLNRHYKVEKEKSLTNIFKISENNPYMEEVIYESLGTSIYELIEPNMIVFEGKTDKDLFDAFTDKYKADFKPQKCGTISADGAKKIPTYTKFFNGNVVSGVVVVDSDAEGKGIKNKVLEQDNFSEKNTYEINDVVNTEIEATLEDLLPFEIIQDIINKEYKVSVSLDSTKPLLKQLVKNNKDHDVKIDIELLKRKITQFILDDITKLTKSGCKEKYTKYYEFVDTLHKKIKDV
ncbi:MAG: AAA family ATPase [Spirochaetes bacterium]|nr:AAA family ATPase [Spirochaetota bacterium]